MAGKRTMVDNIIFDSELEADHYKYLKTLTKVKIIKFQPEFSLFEDFNYFDLKKGKDTKYRKMIYTSDFLLEVPDLSRPIALEVKGFQRSDYQMRKKLFIMKYNKEFYFFQSDKLKECKEYFDRYK